MSHSPQFQHILESICELGCQQVNKIIDAIEQGEVPEQAHPLPKDQLPELLHELKAIMSVYDQPCDI